VAGAEGRQAGAFFALNVWLSILSGKVLANPPSPAEEKIPGHRKFWLTNATVSNLTFENVSASGGGE
jgi:hypothetical protein